MPTRIIHFLVCPHDILSSLFGLPLRFFLSTLPEPAFSGFDRANTKKTEQEDWLVSRTHHLVCWMSALKGLNSLQTLSYLTTKPAKPGHPKLETPYSLSPKLPPPPPPSHPTTRTEAMAMKMRHRLHNLEFKRPTSVAECGPQHHGGRVQGEFVSRF